MAEEKKENAAKAQKSKACKVKGCKRPYRAKGYCTAHFHKWRNGELPKGRYKTCNQGVKKLKRGEKKECFKKVFRSGLCEDHYKAARAKAAPTATTTPAAAPAATSA